MLIEASRLNAERTSDLGVRVWGDAHPEIAMTALIGYGEPVLMIADHVSGTARERTVMLWAILRVSVGTPGYYVLLVDALPN